MIVDPSFLDAALRGKGWRATSGNGYRKGKWEVVFDTSSWLMTFASDGRRSFDVHVPDEYEAAWSANLIEHLCASADRIAALEAALEKIGTARSLADAQQIAASIAADR